MVIMLWYHAVRNRYSSAFIKALLTKVNSKAIDQAILQQDDQGYNILHSACHYNLKDLYFIMGFRTKQSNAALIALLEKASSEAIQKAILQKDYTHRQNVLHRACSDSYSHFIALLEKASPETIGQAILQQDHINRNLLHTVAISSNQSFLSDFIIFITSFKKVSSKIINQAILQEDLSGRNVLNIAGYNQSSSAFIFTLLKQEEMHKKRLQEIKKQIDDKSNWVIHGLWGGSLYQNKAIYKTSFLILKEIERAYQSEKSGYAIDRRTWRQATINVEELVLKGTLKKRWRDRDSINFNRNLCFMFKEHRKNIANYQTDKMEVTLS